MVRILLINESSQMRQFISGLLKSTPTVTQVVTAANGELAQRQIARQPFELILMEIQAASGDFQLLEAIKRSHPRLPVILLSQQAVQGADVTVQALMRGAVDYLTLPARLPLSSADQETFRERLLGLLKWLRPATGPLTPPPPVPRETHRPQRQVDVLVIGSSTGGPKILEDLLAALPVNLSIPVAIVQHISANFVADFAHSLGRKCALPVKVARHGESLQPGEVVLAAGERHLLLQRQLHRVVTILDDSPPQNSCKPSVDMLFRSAAGCYGPGVLGLVLTGMGNDGLAGAREIREHGGHMLVQDQASSVVWGMPGAIANAGLADGILSPSELIREILTRFDTLQRGHIRGE